MAFVQIISFLNLVVSFVTLALIVLIWWQGRKFLENFIFSIVAFCFLIIPLSNFFIDFSKDFSVVNFWIRVVFISPIIAASAILLFSKIFPVRQKISVWFYLFLSLPLPLLLLIPTELNVKSFQIYSDQPTTFEPGILYPIVFVVFSFYFTFALVSFFISYRKYSGVRKLQIKYVFLGLLLSIGCLIITNVVAPIFEWAWLPSIGPSFTLVFLAFIFYAIIKHHLMDIRLIIQKGVIYSLLFLIVAAIYIGAIISVNYFIPSVTKQQIFITAGLTVVFLAFSLPFLEKKFQHWTDRIFFKEPIDYSGALKKLNYTFTKEINLDSLKKRTLETIRDSLKVESVQFFLCLKKTVIPLGEKRRLLDQQYVCNHSVLVKYFRKTTNSQQVLLLDDLERESNIGNMSSRQLASLIDEMRRLKVSLCVSLIGQDNFLGVLCVGEKKNKDPYFVSDLEWLDIVSRQFGLAIERSALYDNLERLVELRTKKLIAANQQLKQISEAKSEFVSVASHQLRTPLTVINSILSLLVDGDLGDLNVQQVEYISRGLLQSQKLIKLINQLLSISRIEAGRMNLKIEASNLNNLIKENVNALKDLAKEKGVQLKMKLALDLPSIHLDRSLISEVLVNLIDNSIKYSPKGKIMVQSIYKKGLARVEISDNGIGLTKEEQNNLFKRFIRGSQQSRLLVSGTGLGLYFSRRVIDSHNGTIWAESQGENTGATFIFELPIK